MPSLRRLRCAGPRCPDRRRLAPDPAAPLFLVCGACGYRGAANDYLRRYSRITGNLIASGGVMMAVAWARAPASGRLALILTGATVFGYALSRIVWQSRVLRHLNALQAALAGRRTN